MGSPAATASATSTAPAQAARQHAAGRERRDPGLPACLPAPQGWLGPMPYATKPGSRFREGGLKFLSNELELLASNSSCQRGLTGARGRATTDITVGGRSLKRSSSLFEGTLSPQRLQAQSRSQC